MYLLGIGQSRLHYYSALGFWEYGNGEGEGGEWDPGIEMLGLGMILVLWVLLIDD